MRDTSNFRTKTKIQENDNGYIKGKWIIGLDIGYSAVKLFSPNTIAKFPAYAKIVDKNFNFVTGAPDNAILYRDEAGTTWLIGELAQNSLSDKDTSDSEAVLYNREWMRTPMYKVLAEAGLGIAMQKAEFTDSNENKYIIAPGEYDKIIIQTGLPEKYLNNTEEVEDVLCGKHQFSLKIGKKPWQDFCINIEKGNINVMSQPKGTLFSICVGNNGGMYQDATKYLSSSAIVFDAGFGTLDIFLMQNGHVISGETYSELGMKRILKNTTERIKQEFDIDIPVPSMQKYLETGTVRYKSRKKGEFISKEIAFGDILAEESKKVCEEAINKMADAVDLLDYNYLFISGGTGAAWFNQIKSTFENFETLKVIQGNQNSNLPFVYANARGYYLYRFNKERQAG